MSIQAVIQVYDEVRRLAIAGSTVAVGDFRLKKLVGPLQKSAEKAPVFGRVAEGITKLVHGAEKETAQALLELGTLVNAILYTQGETGAAGELKDVETTDIGVVTTQTSARVLKPIIEALTTTGSGRLEIVKDAHQRGAFRDLRLVNYAIKGLDDVYGELADFIADQVLPTYGNAILPELRAAYDVQGKGMGHVRRLLVMHRLDPHGSRPLVEQALESGTKEMKVAALECLGERTEDLPHLIEQAGAKAKEVRQAALRGLAKIHDDDAVLDAFARALAGGDLDIAAGPVSRNRHPKVLSRLIDEARQQLEALFATKDKAKLKPLLARFNGFLACFEGRDDKATVSLLADCFARREQLKTLKGDAVGGQDINETVARLLGRSGAKPAQTLLVDAVETLDAGSLEYAFVAATSTRTPGQVFEIFSPLLAAKGDAKKKRRDSAVQRRDALRQLLLHTEEDEGPTGHCPAHEQSALVRRSQLDPRWLDAAIDASDLHVVRSLARPNHARCAAFLAESFHSKMKGKVEEPDLLHALDGLIEIAYPAAADCFIQMLRKTSLLKRPIYAMYWLLQLIPKLPRDAAPEIEGVLPSLPDKVVDEVLPFLQQLKAKD